MTGFGRRLGVGIAAMAMALAAATTGKAEEVLTAVTMFPRGMVYTDSFLGFVEQVNAAGKGVVQIRHIGGPEAVPAAEQAEAVRNGVVDIAYGPGTYYSGRVPEVDALVGSNLTPMETRANGGVALLDEIHRRKLNAHYLARIDGGVRFHIYLARPPARTAEGGVDLSGMKLRSAAIYREFFTGLGAVHVGIPVPEVYTALERGVVDGMGWTSIGVMDFSWDRFLKVRIDPGFTQTDLGILVNLDRWQRLGDEARALLTEIAVAYEEESFERLEALRAQEEAELEARGVEILRLEGDAAAAYLRAAHDAAWDRLRQRDPTWHDRLRAAFYRE